VDSFDTLVALTERSVAAEVIRDQAAYYAAMAESDKLGDALVTALDEWLAAMQASGL
jgi:ABC-type amino acid transport substrate-binding protein